MWADTASEYNPRVLQLSASDDLYSARKGYAPMSQNIYDSPMEQIFQHLWTNTADFPSPEIYCPVSGHF